MSPTTTPAAQLPPTLPSLATAYRALVVGATGAIGAALVAQLQADPRCAAVCALSRRSNPAIDFAAPDSIAAAAQALRAQGPWHLIVVTTGMLTGPTSGPEKEEYESKFAELPEPLSAEERQQWLAKNTGVALASDAFFPFSDNVYRAVRSGASYISAPFGSVQDKAVLAAANSFDLVYVENNIRLFHH